MFDPDDAGIIPYNYEPEYTEHELEQLENDREMAESMQWSTDMCECTNCERMPSTRENVCCHGSDLTVGNLNDHTCITDLPQFDLIVLNPSVFEVAYIQIMAYKGNRGRAPDTLTNAQSRLTAYRQFVCRMLKGEKLGKGNRVVIPACVVMKIRRHFPDDKEEYTGFRTAMESIGELFS